MTKPFYEEVTTDNGNAYIKRTTEDGIVSFIPKDPANSDYQAYLNKDNPDQPIGGNK
jgi:hypothetical protein